MLQYKKTDVSEGIDTNKTSASKECMLRFEALVCNKCHHFLVTAYELKNIATLKVKWVDFRCILCGISRDDSVNRMNNSVLEDRSVL